MDRIRLKSNDLLSVGYDEALQILEIQFHHGGIYQYFGVPKKIYDGLKPLTADDVAEIIYYCASLPPHVCINDLSVTCLQQADTIYFNRQPGH